jgi:hypothetical protein
MMPTNQNPQKTQILKGLFDALREDEERMKQLIEAAAQISQPFATPQPMPMIGGGGLLQQPMHPAMTPIATGMMGIEAEGDAEKLARLKALLGLE